MKGDKKTKQSKMKYYDPLLPFPQTLNTRETRDTTERHLIDIEWNKREVLVTMKPSMSPNPARTFPQPAQTAIQPRTYSALQGRPSQSPVDAHDTASEAVDTLPRAPAKPAACTHHSPEVPAAECRSWAATRWQASRCSPEAPVSRCCEARARRRRSGPSWPCFRARGVLGGLAHPLPAAAPPCSCCAFGGRRMPRRRLRQ